MIRSIGIAGSASAMLSRTERLNSSLLQNHADLPAQPGGIHHGEIDAVDKHPSAFRHIEPLDQFGQRTLARAGGADDTDDLSGLRAETDIMEHFRAIDPVTERDVFESDIATYCR